MIKVKDVLGALSVLAPIEIKEEWDNVGLMVGDGEAEVSGIITALDCTMMVIDEAIEKGANLIVTHHPLIFEKLSNITACDINGSKIIKLIKNGISVISMHTNLDKARGGINDLLCEIIGLKNVRNLDESEYSLGRTGEVEDTVTLKDFVFNIKKKLNSDCIKYIGDDNRIIKTVSLVSGSGCEFYESAINCGADVFLTSEVKHHIACEIIDKGFAIIDAGHFETENIITEKIKSFLEEKLSVKVNISESYIKTFKKG